jgi:hypothetical protein
LSEKIVLEPTAEKSFDVLASIKLCQFDLENFGDIQPETKQRVFDEELTYIAEGINLPLHTEFVLHEQEGQLAYFHKGEWRSYVGSLADNLLLAQKEAKKDPRRQFLAERAAEDLRNGYQIATLKPQQKLEFESRFPQKELELYGEEFIGDLGFQPHRKMGFIYEAEKTVDGRTILRSQSVDGNEADAYDAAMQRGAESGTIEDMRDAYDVAMQLKYGEAFFAGRPVGENVPEENAWQLIMKNNDLTAYLMDQIDSIARSNLTENELEAYESASARGEVMFGCGGSISGENAIMNASSKEVFNMIFGKKEKWFGCYYCGAQQYGDPCAANLYCPTCTAKVKNRKVISKGTGRKGFLDILGEEFREWNRKYDEEQVQKKLARQKVEEEQKLKQAA